MAYLSRVVYPSDGVTQNYTITFPYIDRDHIVVTVGNTPAGFSFLSDTQIRLDQPCSAGSKITISRNTPKDEKLVSFVDGAALVVSELDLSNDQLLYVAQEAFDASEDALAAAVSGGGGGTGGGTGDMQKSSYDTNGDGKVDHAEVADQAPWNGITGKPSSFVPNPHTHAEGDITGLSADLTSLQTQVNGKANSAHTHTEADVAGLSADLANKSDVTHNHDATYEPKNANIQAHIGSTVNPHNVTAAQAGAVPAVNVGAANGVAPLGSDSKVPSAYLPSAVTGQMAYQSTYNASTGSPALPLSNASTKGSYWLVNVAGTQTISGLGTIDLQVGDWIVSAGDGTFQKIDNTDALASWNGRTGAVVPQSGDYTLDQVTDTATRVAVSPAQKGQIHDPATIATHSVDEAGITDMYPLIYNSTSGKYGFAGNIQTLTANSTAPTLGRYQQFTLGAYTQATTITTFNNAPDSIPFIVRGSTYCTLQHNTSVMRLAGNKDYCFGSSSDYIMLVKFGTVLFEVARSNPYGVMSAKGDLQVGLSAGQGSNLALGTDGQVLTVDTSRAQGVKWATMTGSTIDYTLGLVSISGATTLTGTAFGRAHSITGSSYTITLPTPSPGLAIALKCNGTTGMITLDAGAGITIEGVQQRQIWGYESVTLLAQNTTTWVATERVKIPMAVVLMGNANQIPTVATWTQLTYTSAGTSTAASGVQDAANGRIVIPRAATWEFMHTLHNQATNTSAHQVGCRVYKNGGLVGPSMTVSVPASSYANAVACTTEIVASGDLITPWGYYSAGTYTTSFTLSSNARLAGKEVSFW